LNAYPGLTGLCENLCRRYAARVNFPHYPGLAPGAHPTVAASRLDLRQVAAPSTTESFLLEYSHRLSRPGLTSVLPCGLPLPSPGDSIPFLTPPTVETVGYHLPRPRRSWS